MTAIIAWPAPIWTKSKAEGSRLILLKGHLINILPPLILKLSRPEQSEWFATVVFLQSLAACASAAIGWHISHHVAWPEYSLYFLFFCWLASKGRPTCLQNQPTEKEHSLLLDEWLWKLTYCNPKTTATIPEHMYIILTWWLYFIFEWHFCRRPGKNNNSVQNYFHSQLICIADDYLDFDQFNLYVMIVVIGDFFTHFHSLSWCQCLATIRWTATLDISTLI